MSSEDFGAQKSVSKLRPGCR